MHAAGLRAAGYREGRGRCQDGYRSGESSIDLKRKRAKGGQGGGYASGKARAGRDSRYHIGQSLRHVRFGEGVVTGIEGNGDDARIQIRFKAPHGVKWLALAVAKLEPV
ncbi:hypothetical protein [Lautropia mirabilis]|uniref:hypothetical protein n=1 Tax=Lautropia mirabilis TaxID=47671 RepID=UPI0035D08E4C